MNGTKRAVIREAMSYTKISLFLNAGKRTKPDKQRNKEPTTMKMKTTTKSRKPKVKVQDMKPKKDAKGGSRHTGGVNVALGDGSVRSNLQIADLTSVAIDP